MVPNCIFLHLFHISRGTDFIKEKKIIKKRTNESKQAFSSQSKGAQSNCDQSVLPQNLFFLVPIPFLIFLIFFFFFFFSAIINSVSGTCIALVQIWPLSTLLTLFLNEFHNILFTMSLLPDTCHLPRGRIDGIVFNTVSPSGKYRK